MSNPFELIRVAHFRKVEKANAMIMHGQVQAALPLFEQALKKDIVAFYHQQEAVGQWLVNSSSNDGYDRIVLMLAEYYIQSRRWSEWQRLVRVLFDHPNYKLIHPRDRNRLEVISYYGSLGNNIRLKNAIKVLDNWIHDPKVDDLTRGITWFVLGRIFTQIRNEDSAKAAIKLAIKYCSSEQADFYTALGYEAEGTIYYSLNQKRLGYYEQAAKLYAEAEIFTRSLNDGYDFAHNAYNLGWTYAEMKNYDLAIFHFHRGHQEAVETNASYEIAQYQYGMGYIYLMINQLEKALEYFQSAIVFFADESYLMTATCLNLIAAVLREQGDTVKALERLIDATGNLKRADHPTQLHHIYRQLSFLYRDKKQWFLTCKYVLLTYFLKVRYRRPLWPY